MIITDRIIVDRQLQEAILGIEHKSGQVKVMDDRCDSEDLAIALGGNTKIVVTTIHKLIDNIGNRDYLQVLAYMFRFDAKIGYYLYPEAGDSDDLKLRMNRGSTYEANVVPRDDISITKHGLKIPVDAPNYASFVTRMEISERAFVSAFSTTAI